MSQYLHLKDTTPKSRKERQCYLCCETIPVGERHVARTSLNDGNVDTIRMHEECEKESQSWDAMDWECFECGGLERPEKKESVEV